MEASMGSCHVLYMTEYLFRSNILTCCWLSQLRLSQPHPPLSPSPSTRLCLWETEYFLTRTTRCVVRVVGIFGTHRLLFKMSKNDIVVVAIKPAPETAELEALAGGTTWPHTRWRRLALAGAGLDWLQPRGFHSEHRGPMW